MKLEFGGFMHGYNFHWFFGGGYLMGILALILVVVLVVFLIRGAGVFGGAPRDIRERGMYHNGESFRENLNEGKEALEILKERYAKGEISKEQFEQMRRDIED